MDFQRMFTETQGKPIQYKGKELKMIDRVTLPKNKVSLQVEIISTDSKWKQGIILQTKGGFIVNGMKAPYKVVFWEDTAPKQIKVEVNSKDKLLIVYNVWQTDDGTVHYWYYGGALFIEQINGATVYHCNDGYPDDDFNDIIFKIEYF